MLFAVFGSELKQRIVGDIYRHLSMTFTGLLKVSAGNVRQVRAVIELILELIIGLRIRAIEWGKGEQMFF